ncbi:hypothetical protein [uncultured Parvimonas sp.]|nr:hypothetical protein [uncultured Parvimonas sp.]
MELFGFDTDMSDEKLEKKKIEFEKNNKKIPKEDYFDEQKRGY